MHSKPEYYYHPWDPQKVALNQKVFVVIIAGLGIQASCYWEAAIVQRYSLTQVWLYLHINRVELEWVCFTVLDRAWVEGLSFK